MEIEVQPATLMHAFALAPVMRAADALECEALGNPPLTAVLLSLDMSRHAWAATYDGEIVAMWGLYGIRETMLTGPTAAWVWFLTAHRFAELPYACYRLAKRVLPAMLSVYPRLRCAIDYRHRGAWRLAQQLGFALAPPVPVGPDGFPFTLAQLEVA